LPPERAMSDSPLERTGAESRKVTGGSGWRPGVPPCRCRRVDRHNTDRTRQQAVRTFDNSVSKSRSRLRRRSHFWAAYGTGTPRSLQIFLASSSLISECRGTDEDRPAARFTKIE
jgi:hypothetical protein